MVMDASMAANNSEGTKSVGARVGVCWRMLVCWWVWHVPILRPVSSLNDISFTAAGAASAISLAKFLMPMVDCHKVRLLVNEEVEASQQQAKNVAFAFSRHRAAVVIIIPLKT